MSEIEKEVIKATIRGFSRVMILWLLSKKPLSGYSVAKELKRLTGLNFHPGVVYPLLYELEENKFIAGEWVQKGRRQMKCYSITKEGTELLNRVKNMLEMPLKEILKDLISTA
ncbi:PadR family transcriptional regulator [Candidatus Bathyarchaeota archaeon]|nr:PadR family transcriptional regulator [Candidatus Bathyarchaeota archaeon]